MWGKNSALDGGLRVLFYKTSFSVEVLGLICDYWVLTYKTIFLSFNCLMHFINQYDIKCFDAIELLTLMLVLCHTSNQRRYEKLLFSALESIAVTQTVKMYGMSKSLCF